LKAQGKEHITLKGQQKRLPRESVRFILYVILAWARGAQVICYFWVCLWRCLQIISICTGGCTVPSSVLGTSSNLYEPEQNKRQRREKILPSCFLPDCMSWDISFPIPLDWDSRQWLLWCSGFWIWTWVTPSFSWVSSLWWEIMGVVSLQNHMSQLCIIHLLPKLYLRFCVSGEPWFIHKEYVRLSSCWEMRPKSWWDLYTVPITVLLLPITGLSSQSQAIRLQTVPSW
jgi:hypothetical protein